MVGVIMLPILLFLILFTLLYVPPVQRWLVSEATEIASEETGMTIRIGSVSLAFPLDLAVNDVLVTRTESVTNVIDTIAEVKRLVADVELLPLLQGRVLINTFEFNDVKFNTSDFVAAAQIIGTIETFTLESRGIDLVSQSVTLNKTYLNGADIGVYLLNDTTAADTTTSETAWKILTNDVVLERTSLSLHTIEDSMTVRAGIGSATMKGGEIDLGKALYAVDEFVLKGGNVRFDNNVADTVSGFDYNHIALDNINIAIDSIFYNAPVARLNLRECVMKEKCGLEIVQLECPVSMDATTLHVPGLKLLTPNSDLEALAKVDFNVMDPTNPGQLYLRLFASVGKQDIIYLLNGLPTAFHRTYPTSPMTLRGSATGNMQHIDIEGFSVDLPTAFHVALTGTAGNLTNMDRLKADIDIEGATENLDFVMAMVDPSSAATLRIPKGIKLDGNLKADGKRYGVDFLARQDSGTVNVVADYNGSNDAYMAEVSVSDLNLHNILPQDSLYDFSAHAKVEGMGFDMFAKQTRLVAEAKITELRYGSWNINKVNAKALVKDGVAHAGIESHNPLADGTVKLDALMSRKSVDATLVTDLHKADFFTLRMTEKPFTAGMCAHIDLKSDLDQSHKLEGYINDLTLITEKRTYRPADINVDMFTCPDTTWAKMTSGNLALSLTASGGYVKIMNSGDSIMAEMSRQKTNRIIDQVALQHKLPVISLKLTSGRENPFANFLRYGGVDFDDLSLALNTSPVAGITGNFHLYSLVTDSMQIDTVRLAIEHDSLEYIRLHGEVANRRGNPQFVFKAVADGYFFERKIGVDVKYFDDQNRLGLYLGTHAEMRDSGIHVRLTPDRPMLGYKEFNLNRDNFIFLGRDKKVRAGVDLIADDGTGVKLYSTDENNSDMLQDITVTLHKFDLGKLTSVMPYMPRITGMLNGDFRLMQDKREQLSMLSYLSVDDMTYEKNPMGDLSSEFAYLLRDDSTHVVDATLNCNEREIGVLNGSYKAAGDGWLDAMLTLTRFPLSMANGLIPDGLLGLTGYGEGNLSVKGRVSKPIVNGELFLDSTHVISVPYGLNMRADNDPVRIENSKLMLENFSVYGHNNLPLTISGNIDFSNFDRINIAFRMAARDYLLINSKKQKGSIAYGKAYVNFFAGVNGRLDDLRMRGRLDVLGKTDLTYILKDSPLSTDDRLKDLVTFTDFRDTAKVKVDRPPIGGLDMQLTVNVENGTRVMCALNAAQTNYVSIEGGGELRMLYTPINDLQLFGRYTVNDGEMKYALPVIPLKTFKLQKGSFIEFTGDVMNPKLNLTAIEQTKAQVTATDGSTRSVLFDCGVKITQTLNNLGLEFMLDAPEDMTIKNELASMGKDQRGRLAVTMLTTGMYLNDGNTGAFSMNSALSSFLQNEINSITNNAMRSVDISVGMDQNSDAAGNTRTDYSFKFAKRFWNNRVNLVVGGKISDASDNSAPTTEQNESFIDNVSLEYRLDQNAQRNVRLFYNKDASDLLEDDVSEYGAGFVWRKKMNNLGELFKSSKNAYRYAQRPTQGGFMTRRSAVGQKRDAVATDSIGTVVKSDTIQVNKVEK